MIRGPSNTFLLSAVRWDIFATLTFRQEPSLWAGVAHAERWLGEARVRCRLPATAWFNFLRPELGEKMGRLHFHALLKVPPKFRGLFVVPQGCIPVMHRVWGLGMTRFRLVEDSFDPCSWYLQKGDTSPQDGYELTKTSVSLHGFPSSALTRRVNLQQSGGEAGQHGSPPSDYTLSLAAGPAGSLRSVVSLRARETRSLCV